ncbi:unnamed protein product [Urochloa decumbens]|uniref:F-box domain-containing protein n=1 Tax=Urochloa decumbens TaxID=240449 RepID=A0ABC9BWJ1_9POAL
MLSDREDLISTLPSDVLLSILEKLQLRDAARAGVLSQRWRSLPHQLPRLAMDFNDFLLPAEAQLHVHRPRPQRSHGHWQVCAGELDISTTYDLDDRYDDGQHAGVVMLAYGRRFRTLFDGCPAAFGGLTRLAMKNMYLRGCDLDDVLTTCTMLETMSLHDCDTGWPQLVSLPDASVMSFGHVPRLATPDPCQHCLRFTDLRLNFRGENIWVKPESPKRFTNMFCNLKHVKIRNLHEDCGLSWISFLLQVSPCLKELHIKLVCDCECEIEEDNEDGFATKKTNVPWEVAAGFKHYGLTRVTIMGLHSTGESIAVAYIRRLVEAAVNLEEIRCVGKLDMPCDECGATGTGYPSTDQEKDSLRQRISGGEPVPFKICIQF